MGAVMSDYYLFLSQSLVNVSHRARTREHGPTPWRKILRVKYIDNPTDLLEKCDQGISDVEKLIILMLLLLVFFFSLFSI